MQTHAAKTTYRGSVIYDHAKHEIRRAYHEEELQARRRRRRKRALGTRSPMAQPQGTNQRWSLDFLSDALTCGRRFRILAIVDDLTRERLCLIAELRSPARGWCASLRC